MAKSVLVPEDFDFRGALNSNNDLNDFFLRSQTGIYYVSNNVVNSPANYAMLIVLGTGSDPTASIATAFQLMVGRSWMYFRGATGNPVTWGGWNKVTFT